MQANTTDRNGRRQREVGYNTEDVMKEFIAGERCRRAVLDRYINRQFDRQGCKEEEQRCNVCRGITTVKGRRRVRVVAQVEEDVSPDMQTLEAHSIILPTILARDCINPILSLTESGIGLYLNYINPILSIPFTSR
jgi:hypothetical protein